VPGRHVSRVFDESGTDPQSQAGKRPIACPAEPPRTERALLIAGRALPTIPPRAPNPTAHFWSGPRRSQLRPGGRNGWVKIVQRLRGAGGRNGWFCRGTCLLHEADNGLPIQPQFTGDAPLRPAALMQGNDAFDESHFEPTCHDQPPSAPGTLGSLGQALRPPQNDWF
jgi:hypothetical protein